MSARSTLHTDRPLISMILLTYKQQRTVAAALNSALLQTYSPLEIIVSDDASPDDSFEIMRQLVSDYEGPHKIILNRNERNLGTGSNLTRAVKLSQGEILVLAAGDDISLPQRCERIVQGWKQHGCRPDLIASSVIDLDEAGQTHDVIVPSDLGQYRTVADWVADRPHVIGAGHAWTRRLFDHFGALPEGSVAEDLIMVFRAICEGGAISLDEPLVEYRRGGISARVRAMSAQEIIDRLQRSNRYTLSEMNTLKQDARKANCLDIVSAWLDAEIAMAEFIRDVFAADSLVGKLSITLSAGDLRWSKRLRMLTYAACPWVLAPFFVIKRIFASAG